MKKYNLKSIIAGLIVAIIGIIISIATYILIDEIEIRRKIVTKVFKNKYNKK